MAQSKLTVGVLLVLACGFLAIAQDSYISKVRFCDPKANGAFIECDNATVTFGDQFVQEINVTRAKCGCTGTCPVLNSTVATYTKLFINTLGPWYVYSIGSNFVLNIV